MRLPGDLRITIRGEVQTSNLTEWSEWKDALLVEIGKMDSVLVTDEDFVGAKGMVKAIKHAEGQLKEAKDKAVSQAKDINAIFREIDEIASKVRQVRLNFERQIRAENKTRRENVLLLGIESVKRIISEQSEEFQLIDHSDYIDHTRFAAAVKGKQNTKSATRAVNNLVSLIESEITQKADDVGRISESLNKLDEKRRLLFPDRSHLLSLSPESFESEKIKRLRDAEAVAGIDDDVPTECGDPLGPAPSLQTEGLDLHEAVKILGALSAGCDPASGEVLPPTHLVLRPDVSRAIGIVVDVMESILEVVVQKDQVVLPAERVPARLRAQPD
jgi:hypothetical protein